MNSKHLLIAAGLLAQAGVSQAAVGNYPVILIHGFQPQQLADKPNATQVSQDGASYWQDFWLQHADARIDWPSQYRLQREISQQYVWPKLQSIAKSGLCNNGCVIVSHSTGDLVTRYILDNQRHWLSQAGLTPLNIVASFDLAGAGGGAELADMAVNVAEGGSLWDAALRAALSLWLGEIPNSQNVGVLQDLRVNTARNTATFPSERTPRLRIVGDASDSFGLTSGFIPGHDDGVVASHSACGSSVAGSFSSCSASMAFNGELASQSNAVKSFMPYHYPLLQSADYSHGTIYNHGWQGKVSAVNSSATFSNGQQIHFNNSYSESGWWLWKKRYSHVSGSGNTSVSQLLVNAL